MNTDWTMVNDDCVKVLRSMKDECIDVIFADPPYGNGTEYRSYSDTRNNLMVLVDMFMPEALRVGKRVVVTCGVANMWLYPAPTWTLAWVNMAGVGSTAWGFSCWQPILVYGNDPYLAAGKGRRPDTFIQRKTEMPVTTHPCPKPINVMKWIVERTSMPGDMILDPFAGTGSTGVAALQMGRHFFGIELDEGYCNEARTQLFNAALQPALFLGDAQAIEMQKEML